MADQIDELFAEFHAQFAPRFRPVPIPVVEQVVRRRLVIRRAALAAVILTVFAVPAVLAVVLRPAALPPALPPPSTTPSGSATPAPSANYETRAVRVPGYPDGTPWVVSFTDATHAWATRKCAASECPWGLAATSDAGRTWRAIDTLDLSGRSFAGYPLDGQTIAFVLTDDWSFRLTTDGGATWTTHREQAPPPEALLADARAWHRDGYVALCPGAYGFEDGGRGIECEHERLIRIGVGPVEPQPVLGGINSNARSTIVVGGDGRVWIVDTYVEPNNTVDAYPMRLRVSSNGATWQYLPDPPVGSRTLLLSPDGSDVWLVGDRYVEGSYRLVDGAWRVQTPELGVVASYEVTALDDGALLIPTDNGIDIYQDGAQGRLPGSPNRAIDRLDRLADGTLLGDTAGGRLLGFGEGPARTWVFFSET